jgi:hypothetical protein
MARRSQRRISDVLKGPRRACLDCLFAERRRSRRVRRRWLVGYIRKWVALLTHRRPRRHRRRPGRWQQMGDGDGIADAV